MLDIVSYNNSNIKSLKFIIFLYVITFGLYRYYWLYMNWKYLYPDNGVDGHEDFQTVTSWFIPLCYIIFVWQQIRDIGQFCERKGIISFRYWKTLATVFSILHIFTTASLGIMINGGNPMPEIIVAPTVELILILFVQTYLNKYWTTEDLNIVQTARYYMKKLIRSLGKKPKNSQKIACAYFGFLMVYFHYKNITGNMSLKASKDKMKQSFQRLIQFPDIITSVGVVQNHHEFDECYNNLSRISKNITHLHNDEKKLIQVLITKTKDLLHSTNRNITYKELTHYLMKNDLVIEKLMSANKLSFIK